MYVYTHTYSFYIFEIQCYISNCYSLMGNLYFILILVDLSVIYFLKLRNEVVYFYMYFEMYVHYRMVVKTPYGFQEYDTLLVSTITKINRSLELTL